MLQFRPGWKMTLFTLCLSPLLLFLGMWQLAREEEKIQLQQDYDLRQQADALPLSDIDGDRDDLAFLKVAVEGQYHNERAWLLDNRVHEGRIGYELLSPFRSVDGDWLVVNRGWVAAGTTRSELPQPPPVAGTVRIQGSIHVPSGEQFMLGTDEAAYGDQWPQVIQSEDLQRMSASLGQPLFPYSIRLLPGSPGLELGNWQTINMLPEKHRAYAVQWFAMLTALLTMYIYLGFRHPEAKRREKQ